MKTTDRDYPEDARIFSKFVRDGVPGYWEQFKVMTSAKWGHYMYKEPNALLTEEEQAEGWHFCKDFDGLLIHKSDPEAQHCSCFNNPQTPPNIQELFPPIIPTNVKDYICIYCGKVERFEENEELKDHIQVHINHCKKHPLFKANQKTKEALDLVKNIIKNICNDCRAVRADLCDDCTWGLTAGKETWKKLSGEKWED